MPPGILICLVCGKEGKPSDVGGMLGWRLAPNRIGGYTCGPTCDDVVTSYDATKKDQKKRGKKS